MSYEATMRRSVDWALAAVVGGLLLPVGIAALAVKALDGDISEAFRHGELFLVGGNAGLVGLTMTLSDPTRRGRGATAVALALPVIAPGYAVSAVFVAASSTHHHTSDSFALQGGLVFAVIGIIASLLVAFWPKGPARAIAGRPAADS